MRPKVRELYRRILHMGRQYPTGLAAVRESAKKEFFEHKDETDEKKINLLLRRGNWRCQEMEKIIQFKKYRGMKKKYD